MRNIIVSNKNVYQKLSKEIKRSTSIIAQTHNHPEITVILLGLLGIVATMHLKMCQHFVVKKRETILFKNVLKI